MGDEEQVVAAVAAVNTFTGCEASPHIALLVTALAKAQAEFPPVEKDKTARITSQKGNYAYAYADLATILAVVRPVMAKHGIALIQPVSIQSGAVAVRTILAHSSGEWMAADLVFRAGDGDPRSVASVITYGRRYGLITMIGVAATDEDDDAAAATPVRSNGHRAAQPASEPAPRPTASATDKPDGFDDWLDDLVAVADEGQDALKSAWTKSQPYLRKYLTDTDNAKWEAIKAKSTQVKVPA
jgi:hypothetical protein